MTTQTKAQPIVARIAGGLVSEFFKGIFICFGVTAIYLASTALNASQFFK